MKIEICRTYEIECSIVCYQARQDRIFILHKPKGVTSIYGWIEECDEKFDDNLGISAVAYQLDAERGYLVELGEL
jgi:hypothetical protein